ncbi:MAG: helix-turn-helix domain-containing protein, partial [Propionicimonas sp.]
SPAGQPAHITVALRTLGNPMRFEILRELNTAGPSSHGDLIRRLDSGVSQVSRYLSDLAGLGLVYAEDSRLVRGASKTVLIHPDRDALIRQLEVLQAYGLGES